MKLKMPEILAGDSQLIQPQSQVEGDLSVLPLSKQS